MTDEREPDPVAHRKAEEERQLEWKKDLKGGQLPRDRKEQRKADAIRKGEWE